MHIGIPQIDPRDANNFVGKPVDYAARLNDYATGGQILVSRSVVAVLEDAGMDGVSFHLHGRRDLKGIGLVDVYELVYDATRPAEDAAAAARESVARMDRAPGDDRPHRVPGRAARGPTCVLASPPAVARAEEARQLRAAGAARRRRHGRRLQGPASAVRPRSGP